LLATQKRPRRTAVPWISPAAALRYRARERGAWKEPPSPVHRWTKKARTIHGKCETLVRKSMDPWKINEKIQQGIYFSEI